MKQIKATNCLTHSKLDKHHAQRTDSLWNESLQRIRLCIHSAIYLDTDTAGLCNSDRILHNKALNYFIRLDKQLGN